MRLRPRTFQPEELLPNVTKRVGKPLRFISQADRAAMEKLIASLKREPVRLAA
jgi:hypothetical protein